MNAMDTMRATSEALDDLVTSTGKSLRYGAAAVAIFTEQQRRQIVAAATAGEPGLEKMQVRALAAVRLFAGVEAAVQGDAFDSRFAAIIGVALQVAT